jgi:hypothetical protein
MVNKAARNLGKLGGKRTKELHPEQLSQMGKKGRKFLESMTLEEKKEYFRKVRSGTKIK